MKFPKTLAAVKSAEKNLWEIGDAVLAECGEPSKDGVKNGSSEKISLAASVLSENGFDYSENTLRIYRDTAFNFPPASRLAGISFAVHQETYNPETLKAVMSRLKPGEKLTKAKTRNIIDQIEDEKEDAKQIKQKTVIAWTGKPNITPPPPAAQQPSSPAPQQEASALPSMIAISKAVSNANESLRFAAETLTTIQPYIENMASSDRDSLVELALSNHTKWLEIANKLRENGKDHRSHLTAVS